MAAATKFRYANVSVHLLHDGLLGCAAKAGVLPTTCDLTSLCTLCGPKSICVLPRRLPDLARLRKQIAELGKLGYRKAVVVSDTRGMGAARRRLRGLGGGR